MAVRERTNNRVTNMQRIILRRMPLAVLETAYDESNSGYSEALICTTLGISREIFEGALRPALEEALWERGRLGTGLSTL